MVKSISYYNHSPVFYILNVRQLQDVMNQIRLGQTEYYTFMFLSYGDMDVQKLQQKFSNIQIFKRELHSMKHYCIWPGDVPVRIKKLQPTF